MTNIKFFSYNFYKVENLFNSYIVAGLSNLPGPYIKCAAVQCTVLDTINEIKIIHLSKTMDTFPRPSDTFPRQSDTLPRSSDTFPRPSDTFLRPRFDKILYYWRTFGKIFYAILFHFTICRELSTLNSAHDPTSKLLLFRDTRL